MYILVQTAILSWNSSFNIVLSFAIPLLDWFVIGAVMMVDPDNPLVSPTKTTQDQIDRFEYNGRLKHYTKSTLGWLHLIWTN